jgi:nicotinamidase-related amidase
VLIDVINHFEFPDGDNIFENALPIAPRLARLKKKAREENIPVIYVNDNFGQWRSDAGKLLTHCLRAGSAGKPFVEAVRPDEKDYFVLKPMHSAFYQTPLQLLLHYLGTSSLILAGLATNSGILCTAPTRTWGISKSGWFPIVAPHARRASTTKHWKTSGKWRAVVLLPSLRCV